MINLAETLANELVELVDYKYSEVIIQLAISSSLRH